MLTEKRYAAILRKLDKDGSVSATELAAMFEVSAETIRRDLMNMEARGMLRRVFGGAVKSEIMNVYRDLPEREMTRYAQKRAVAVKAADLVNENDVIAMDTGSTAVAIAEELKKRFDKLTVITYSMKVFDVLKDKFAVILTGGEYYEKEDCFFGTVTLNTMSGLHAEKCFLCASAISTRHGLEDYVPSIIPVQQQLCKISDRVIVCADSSKFETRGLLKLGDIGDADAFVTDSDISDETRRIISDMGKPIYVGNIEQS